MFAPTSLRSHHHSRRALENPS